MKLFFIIATLITSISAFAGDRNTAYEAVCKNMTFESDKARCLQAIKPFSYFNDGALSICPFFPFASTQIECLTIIGDKRYEAYEVNTCKNTVFDSEKLRCLRENGQMGGGQACIPTREILDQLRSAQYELRSGQTGIVDKRLSYLISQLNTCN